MLIGSRALAYWLPEYRLRIKPQTDWDVISDRTEAFPGIEIHRPDEYLSAEAVERFNTTERVVLPDGSIDTVCSLRGLAAIKRSHLALDWNFNKHMTQYVQHLQQHLNLQDWDFIKRRERITLNKARQKDMKLNKGKAAFFDDGIVKKYDHDFLHELVAFYDRPLYTRINADGAEVLCSKEKWQQLQYEDQLKCLQEEVYVIALERWLIPSEFTEYPRGAYLKAVQKACTTLTSAWFRDFAIDNWKQVCNAYDAAKILDVQQKLKEITYV